MKSSFAALIVVVGVSLAICVLVGIMARLRIKKLHIAVATGFLLFGGLFLATYVEFSHTSVFDLIGTGLIGAFVAFLTYFALKVGEKLTK